MLTVPGVTVREATQDDLVGGVRPRWVALPETVEEIAAVMRASAAHDLAVVTVGGGTKLHWGAPPERCDLLIDTCCLGDVLEHAAGDLVVRVQAGTTMETLAETLAREGQELALDVPLEGATVGGTLATATAGPRRLRYGTARDLLIGITAVLADGTIAHSGGRVVKNVAGYDLGKLFTGSYGTLAVIAEATFRLHPLPAERRWITAEFPPDELSFPMRDLLDSQHEPVAIEVDWPDLSGPCTVCVLVEGVAAEERATAVRDLLKPPATVEASPPPWWGRLPDGILIEARGPRLTLAADLPHVRDAAGRFDVTLRGSVAAGAMHVTPASDSDPGQVAAFLTELRSRLSGPVVLLAAPDEVAALVDRWGPTGGLTLMRRVKERFDPDRRLSPGRFVGGL
ncbi:FAD-binding oxidoreductase [Streptosporangiaceae bacterium NEAU-GS5]|nr:FAD-binding oxidoreductase [Streptosporangiaceae bacterium NEAU-GS5]